ncbi:hypothetical protein [Aurantiacibacter gilvus]|uniref:Secreted protein n=1 Tax=Aurantiacibacter gilvus TaxID=3139141 RepID=A0ABU9IDD1_9SPHN
MPLSRYYSPTLRAATAGLFLLGSALPAMPALANGAAPAPASKQDRLPNTREDRERAQVIDTTLTEILDFRLDIRSLIADQDGAWPRIQQQVAEYRRRMDAAINPALVAQANDFSTRPTVRLRDEAERNAERMAGMIASANVESTLAATRESTMFARYSALVQMGEQLRQLQRLYPDNATIAQANQTAAGVLAQLGSFDEIEAQASANVAARIAETRLLAPVRRDAALERSFANAFWASPWANDYRGGEIVRMNLTSSGWTVHTNALGTPVSRDTGTSFAVRAPDGKCYAVRGIFEQRYTGGGYGGSIYASGSHQEMLCANI